MKEAGEQLGAAHNGMQARCRAAREAGTLSCPHCTRRLLHATLHDAQPDTLLQHVEFRLSPCLRAQLTHWLALPAACVVQYYFNALLQLKDEMNQLGERLQPPAP